MVLIYNFVSYRAFLRAYYHYKKEQGRHFSYRYYAQKMGVKGQNYLQWIIDGSRKIAHDKISKLCDVLGLNEEESYYFTKMVEFDHAQSTTEKEALFKQLVTLRTPHIGTHLSEIEYELFSIWYIDAVRHSLNILQINPKEKNAFRKLARHIRPRISESNARHAVRTLEKLELVQSDSDGNLILTEKVLSTGAEVNNFYIKSYHRSMIELAKGSIDNFPSNERDISAVSMAVSKECFEDIKEEIAQCRKRILERVSRDTNPTAVYELTMQLFPLARNDDE